MDDFRGIRLALQRLHRQPEAWPWLLTAGAVAAYLLAFVVTLTSVSVLVRLAGALALGPLIALLFRLAHDCGHGAHFAGRRRNSLFGRCLILPSYHPYSVWLSLHNGRHHAFTNLRERDYIWVPLAPAEFRRLPPARRRLERFYRSTLGFGPYYLYEIWLRKMLVPRRAELRRIRPAHVADAGLVAGFMLLQLGAIAGATTTIAGFTERVVLAIVLPFLVFTWMVGFVSFFNHTHPRVPWFASRRQWAFGQSQLSCTVHMGVPAWFLFFLTDLGLHGTHHVDPRIPIWRLEPARRLITDAVPGQVVRERWSPATHRDVVRRCQLYDYDTHRWTSFAGAPTGPVLLPGSPPDCASAAYRVK